MLKMECGTINKVYEITVSQGFGSKSITVKTTRYGGICDVLSDDIVNNWLKHYEATGEKVIIKIKKDKTGNISINPCTDYALGLMVECNDGNKDVTAYLPFTEKELIGLDKLDFAKKIFEFATKIVEKCDK